MISPGFETTDPFTQTRFVLIREGTASYRLTSLPPA